MDGDPGGEGLCGMGERAIGAASVGKSVRSFLEALASLEREIEFMFERAGSGSAGTLRRYADKLAAGVGGGSAVPDLLGLLKMVGRVSDGSLLSRSLCGFLGAADATSLEIVREDVRELIEQVARLREREITLAGGVSQLRAKTAQFDEALSGLARVQGRCIARMQGQAAQVEQVEQLSARRDDHITRLIRDTASQRGKLERLLRERGDGQQVAASGNANSEMSRRIDAVEMQFQELKKLNKNGTQGVIDTLETLRDRTGRLEARAAEMSREARAKSGRLDALSRHVSSVEGRLKSAIGGEPKGVLPVVSMESSEAPM